jgi:endonuclease YncB( thermonuclease family)
MVDARRAAGQQVGAAGAALAAGSKAAGAAAWDGARAGAGAAGLLLAGLWSILLIAAVNAWALLGVAASYARHYLALAARPLIELLARPHAGFPVLVAGAIALGAGASRYRSAGLDSEALITLALAAALVVAALPALSRATGISLSRMAALGIPPRTAGIAVAGVAALGGIYWFSQHGPKTLAGAVSAKIPLISGSPPLQGRAVVVGSDRLRIGNTTVRLSGIEAPEPQQLCGAAGSRQWRCGGATQAGLARLVGGGLVQCTFDGTDASGGRLARCSRGGKEINAELVRQGHAFAEGGLILTRYGSEEKEARAAKAGIWAAGDSMRPSDYRAKVWEEAKRRAPDGCPIKGVVAGGAKVYLLPWSPEYERGRIQKGRGERWFCSEREALNAGWKAATRG